MSVTFTVQLPDEQALALAQLVKRITFEDCRRLSVDQDEAYTMIDGIDAVRKSLAESGYNPR